MQQQPRVSFANSRRIGSLSRSSPFIDILCNIQKYFQLETKAQIRLRKCAALSGPSFPVYSTRVISLRRASDKYIYPPNSLWIFFWHSSHPEIWHLPWVGYSPLVLALSQDRMPRWVYFCCVIVNVIRGVTIIADSWNIHYIITLYYIQLCGMFLIVSHNIQSVLHEKYIYYTMRCRFTINPLFLISLIRFCDITK